MTATESLSILRDTDLTIGDIAARFGQSETWAAGALDAVDDGMDWAELLSDGGYLAPSDAERADYADGFSFALYALEEVAVADGWNEAYGLAAVEAAYAVVACGPVDDSDIPW